MMLQNPGCALSSSSVIAVLTPSCLSQIMHAHTRTHTIEGSLEAKRPTIWTDEKAEAGRVKEEKRRRKKIREKKEDAGAREGKVAKHGAFPLFKATGEVGSLKRRVRIRLVG
jgi:hypothetical protein